MPQNFPTKSNSSWQRPNLIKLETEKDRMNNCLGIELPQDQIVFEAISEDRERCILQDTIDFTF